LNKDNDNVFYTRTMAKVYADQGNLLKAVEIYRYLLESEPERRDLKDALAEIERKLNEKSPEDLIRLFNRWIDLLLTHHNMQKLIKFRNYLRDSK
jgi:tetratricopeptide (TPR) repeat protein